MLCYFSVNVVYYQNKMSSLCKNTTVSTPNPSFSVALGTYSGGSHAQTSNNQLSHKSTSGWIWWDVQICVVIYNWPFIFGVKKVKYLGLSHKLSWYCSAIVPYKWFNVSNITAPIHCLLKIFQKHFQVHQLIRTTSSSHLTSHLECCRVKHLVKKIRQNYQEEGTSKHCKNFPTLRK